jgi:hypothetical protein
MFETVELAQFLFFEKLRDVEFHTVQIETKVLTAIGSDVFLDDFCTGVLDVKVSGLFGIRRLEMKMVDSECHGILLFGRVLRPFLLPLNGELQSPQYMTVVTLSS